MKPWWSEDMPGGRNAPQQVQLKGVAGWVIWFLANGAGACATKMINNHEYNKRRRNGGGR